VESKEVDRKYDSKGIMNKPKVEILRGKTGRHKTTYARNQVLKHLSIGTVNKDGVRDLIFANSKYGLKGISPNGSPIFKNDKMVEEVRDFIILKLLENKFNVIVDGCHLKDSSVLYIKSLVKGKATTSIRRFP
jgi:hypothetical protein